MKIISNETMKWFDTKRQQQQLRPTETKKKNSLSIFGWDAPCGCATERLDVL